MELDIAEFRKMEAELHGLELPDFSMKFYYDETRNARKFRVSSNGVNSSDAVEYDYILGGIAFACKEEELNIDDLFKQIKLQPTAKELKYNLLVNGHKDFWRGLNRNSLSEFIDWLERNPIYIHYVTLNNLYYAIVDIVDSLWETQSQFCFSQEWVCLLKAALYEVVCKNKEEFYAILGHYEYPDVSDQNIRDFCMEIVCFIENYGDENDFYLECFRQMLKTNAKQGRLLYAQGEEKGELISEYYQMRISRCYMFKNSFHYFDIEEEDMKMMRDVRLLYDGKEFCNYDFVESTGNKLIQVADAVVGLLSNWFHFIDITTEEEFLDLLQNATPKQKKNLKSIAQLIERSEEKHITMLQNLNDISITRRRGRFLTLMQIIV